MSHPSEANLDELIACLHEAGVELIIVGGAAAVLHGAPTTTIDLDIVPKRSEENVARLFAVLQTLDARVRGIGAEATPITAEMLRGLRGQLRLSTRMGPLDCLAILHDGRGYDALYPKTDLVTDGALTMRVVDLPTLIEIKASTGRSRDKLIVPVLVALLQERSAQT